jgi:ATP-dependent RNA helicase DDX31/DBP7
MNDRIKSNLENTFGITTMTESQRLAIPHLLARRDVLLRSPTGTGKTLAYAVPIVEYLSSLEPKVQRSTGPLALIIVPTRELALQCFQVFQQLLKPFVYIVPGCITGGEKRKAEKARLRKGINVLIGTPGRLADHVVHTKSLCLRKLHWLVLDEADR